MLVAAEDAISKQLLTLGVEGLGVAVSVTMFFSIALVATIRASDARKERGVAAAIPWTVVAVLAYAAFAALVILGVRVVVNKD